MFHTKQELDSMGFKSIGENVLISDKASIIGASRMNIGNNVRIDDFCILSAGTGGIEIGDHVHIACYVSIVGKSKITIKDFAGISSRVSVYSSTDDYSGEFMTNPTVPDIYKNVINAEITLEKHAIIGCGSVILPGVTIGEGTSIGAMSLVNKDCEASHIYFGIPAKKIKKKSTKLFELEIKFRNEGK